MKEIVETKKAPAAIGPYSQAVKVRTSELLFCSGQIPLNPVDGNLVYGPVGDQTVWVMENITAILGASGYGLNDVVKTTIYLTDLASFTEVNKVYESYFHGDYPARSTVQVAALPRGASVEIEVIAGK